jgi:hypothetical protein
MKLRRRPYVESFVNSIRKHRRMTMSLFVQYDVTKPTTARGAKLLPPRR